MGRVLGVPGGPRTTKSIINLALLIAGGILINIGTSEVIGLLWVGHCNSFPTKRFCNLECDHTSGKVIIKTCSI